MANKVLLKKSSVAAKIPLTTDLDYGELALNYADGKLYFKNSSNVIKSFTIDDSVVTLAGTQTLTNKTISLGSNTITGTLAQFNAAITDADIAATTHKYHEFTLNAYYYDSYTQERFFRLFTQNATYDTARYSAITNVEYWNGTAWVSWTGGDAYIKNLLDGRDDTYADIDHTHRKFRFTINKNSGWPTNALIATYWSWFGNGWTPYTLTIEDTADSVTWTTKETLTFGNTTNTNADYGWHAFYSGNLHNGRTLNRITYDITDWTDSGAYTTKRIYALSIFSNYNGASDSIGVPVTWNYDKVVNFSAVPTVNSVQVATLTASQTLTNKTINLANNTLTGTLAQFNAALAGTDFASLDGTETLTNKTINLSNNTVSGTVAQFNTALSDGDFATLAGTETLTNKTLNGFTITGPVIAGGNAGANGYILVSAGGAAAPQWQANAAGTLDGLTDVQITSPTAQQILKFNGTIWQNADPDAAVASAVFATNAESDLGLVTDLVIGISEDLGFVYDVPATFIYNMGSLVVDGIVSLNNIDQSIKADYIGYAIIFGF